MAVASLLHPKYAQRRCAFALVVKVKEFGSSFKYVTRIFFLFSFFFPFPSRFLNKQLKLIFEFGCSQSNHLYFIQIKSSF